MARTLLRLFDQKKPGSDNIGIKKEVRVATTQNEDLSTGGLLTIDGITVVAGDRVLVKSQTAPAENGIYVAAVGTWNRAADSDEDDEVFGGELVAVLEGTVNGQSLWINSTTINPIVVGTTAQTFAKLSTMGAITLSNYIVGELPSGTIDGANVTFTLANTPETGTVALYFNGQRLREGGTEDYTISGATITLAFAPKANPSQTDVLLADYISQ